MKRRSLAQKAFRKNDKSLSETAHSREIIRDAIQNPEQHQSSGKYVSDAVYGALDGIVTTFAVVSGVIGADLSLSIIIILGLANLIADGFSMATGSYLSLKSEQDYHKAEYDRELWEIENYPEGEIEEIREIYKGKGFKGKDLENAVSIITKDKKQWIKSMMVEELGITTDDKSPIIVATITFSSFLICGSIPLITFILIRFFPQLNENAFLISGISTGITIFTVGSLRSLVIAKGWFQSGSEMLLLGGTAASVSYAIGFILRGLA